ncbi:MAG TPA: hypothetical protein VNN55_05730 [bacterium]|nr:hypothetical protein [bacterium]
MTTLPISEIIRDSFAIAWRYKYLWLFGLFAGGAGGGLQIPGDSGGGLERIDEIKAWILAALAMILLVGFVVGVIIITLHTISKSALIYNAYQIETGGAHTLSGGWDFGLKRFWPMLGVTLTQWLIMFSFVVILILLEVAIFAISVPLGVLSLLPAIPLFFFGIAAVVVVWAYAERYVVLEDRGVIESIGEGWSLVKSEWQPTVTVLLIKLAIAIAVGIGLMGIGLVLMLPAIGIWAVSKPLAIVYGILVLAPFVILVGAYFGTFDSLVWTKVFLRLRAAAYGAPAVTAPAAPTPPAPGDSPKPPLFE